MSTEWPSIKNTRTVAAYADFTPNHGEEVRQHAGWPVPREWLDAEIDKQATENGWTVIAVSEPVERGPLRCEGVDSDTGVVVEWDRYQLYAYVDLEDA